MKAQIKENDTFAPEKVDDFYKEKTMRYDVNLENFEGQNIEVDSSFFSGVKLLINGEPAPKGEKRGEFVLQSNDGRQVTAAWKPQALGMDIPQLVIDGKVINLVEPLKWYQWAWGGWIGLLVFIGGMLGGLVGFLAFVINAKIFRMDVPGALKYLLTGAVSILALVTYFVAAILLQLALNG